MKDSNGNGIEVGQFVNVPEPNDSDLHTCEFTGLVIGFHDEYVMVQDYDDDVFDIEPERLTIDGEE
jgi:hypothetical protein